MGRLIFSLPLFLFTILIINSPCFITVNSTYVSHFCLGGTYTPNSIYQSNLNLLLNSLSTSITSNTITVKNGYYNNSVGRNPDTVYGSFQCRGDVPLNTCYQDCIIQASKEIILLCSNTKEAIVWYHRCMIRYSNRLSVSASEEASMSYNTTSKFSDKNVNPNEFMKVLVGFMNDLLRNVFSGVSSSVATVSNNSTWFATEERDYTRNGDKIYGFLQCTSDLSRENCRSCLRGVTIDIERYLYGNQEAEFVRPNCCFRYQISSFYGFDSDSASSPSQASLSSSSLNGSRTKNRKRNNIIIVIVVVSVVAILSTIAARYFYSTKRKVKNDVKESSHANIFFEDVDEIRDSESYQFKFNAIDSATDNFSDANKLGRGGFGAVYKGTLSNGQEIAVKRLSKTSGQGDEEFKNEVVLVLRLQHRNLVRLLGFCLDGAERLLIYEFLPNASLDQFIFDPIKRTHLDWGTRYKIIGGIARGLVYLHEDSRLRIIHRDLKASNVLLDGDMNPKIADFGMARSFVVDQIQDSTNRIMGTYGYMAPEYAMHGHFSVKSDVFSFGVLLLEILSGHRINSFVDTEGSQGLLTKAWKKWMNETALEFLDSCLGENYSRNEVMRCIHIGLLCVQEDTSERPTMVSIIQMLSNNSLTLPAPSSPRPCFVYTEKGGTCSSSNVRDDRSNNYASITEVHPR